MTRLLPFLVGLLVFIDMEVAFRRPTFFILSLLAVLIAVAFALWLLCGRKWSKFLFTVMGSQTLLVLGMFAFLLFTESDLTRNIMALSLSSLLFLVLEQLRFLRQSGQEKDVESISGLLLLSYAATMLATSAFLYGLRIFFGIPILLLALVIFLIAFFFHRAIFLNLKTVAVLEGVHYRAFWIALIALEVFIVVYASPASLVVDGALLAIPLAVFLNVYRLKIEDKLESKILLKNILFGFLAIFAVLITANWR